MTSSESAGCTDKAKVLFDALPTLLSAVTLFILPVTPEGLLAATYAESTIPVTTAESVLVNKALLTLRLPVMFIPESSVSNFLLPLK